MRTQSLQDVPVSVSAVTGVKMLEAGIDKIEDLHAYVPNLSMSETGIGTQIYIRGIGSGINQGFEQSVGMYVDGVYYGRSQLARAPFLDLARVEVLRGPQNILYGKNSIAGALSIITTRPSEETEGMVQVAYEPGHGEQVLDFVYGAPISDRWSMRFASRLRGFDGYIENLTLGDDEPNRDEKTFRISLAWDARDDLAGHFKLEHGSFDVKGRQVEIINDEPSTSTIPFFQGRRYSEILDRTEFPDNSSMFPGGAPGPAIDIDEDDSVLNIEQDYKRSSNGDFSKNDTLNFTMSFDLERESGQFTFITGYLAYEFDEICDCDFTGGRVFSVSLFEDYEQFSQEVRWLSEEGGAWEWIAGGYVQFNELVFKDKIIVDSDVVPQLLNAADFIEGGARGDNDPGPHDGTDPFEIGGTGDAGFAVANLTSPRLYTGKSKLASVFAQGTWNMAERWRLTLGARLTWEEKRGSRRLTFADLQGNELPLGEVDTVSAISFGSERHDLKGRREEFQVSPLINVQWDVNDSIMAYLTATQGYKSGGYDARSNASPSAALTPLNPNVAGCTDGNPADGCNQTSLIGAFEYEEEKATSFEAGIKSGFLEGAAELNVALFYTQFNDLQVSIFDGRLGFNVGNAASAITQGLEMNGRLALSESLILAGALAYLDFEFEEYLTGQCFQGQTPDAPDGLNCDYSGKTNQFVADFAGNVSLLFRDEVSENLRLSGNVDLLFSTSFNPSGNLDPKVEEDGYYKINGRIALSSIDETWTVALVGKNLTDEEVVAYANDTPTSNSTFGSIGHYGFLERSRSLGVQASYRF